MIKKGKITGVGLGPGDPDLITVKGLKALQNADVIFYPATEINENKQTSFSIRILNELNLDAPMQPLFIPMSGKNRAEHYLNAFELIRKEYDEGKSVAVVSEGDLLFYSTFGYLLKLVQENSMEYDLIPGIPAFIAAGAAGAQPIVEGNQQFKVIARPGSFSEIEEALKEDTTLVVMKMSVLEGWHEFLENCNNPFYYIERVGTNYQFSTSDAKELAFRSIPYFSIIIFYG